MSKRNQKVSARWKKLDLFDWDMIRAVAREPGITDDKLAKMFGYHRKAINRRRNNPAFQRAYLNQVKGAIERLKEIQSQAVDTLEELMAKSQNDAVRKGSAQIVLDGLPEIASGYAKQQNDNSSEIADRIRQVVPFTVQSRASSGDTSVFQRPDTLQDSPRGPEELQDGIGEEEVGS